MNANEHRDHKRSLVNELARVLNEMEAAGMEPYTRGPIELDGDELFSVRFANPLDQYFRVSATEGQAGNPYTWKVLS